MRCESCSSDRTVTMRTPLTAFVSVTVLLCSKCSKQEKIPYVKLISTLYRKQAELTDVNSPEYQLAEYQCAVHGVAMPELLEDIKNYKETFCCIAL